MNKSYDPASLPPLDVQWHLEALDRVGRANSKVKSEATSASEAFIASMRSPLQVLNPLPCQDEHDLLIKCIADAKRSSDSAQEQSSGSRNADVWRQNLVLASSGSAHHTAAVEQLCESIPDEMPASRLGALVSPCLAAAASFNKCGRESMRKWFAQLQAVHEQQQQQLHQEDHGGGPSLPEKH